MTVGIDVGRGMGHVVVKQITGIGNIGGADVPERGIVLDTVEQIEVFGLNSAQTDGHRWSFLRRMSMMAMKARK